LGTQRKRKPSWISLGLWARARITDFEPLLQFANQILDENNWRIALWEAMGKERLCWISHPSKGGPEKLKTWASELTDEEADPYIPKILDQEATIRLSRELKTKIQQVLDNIIAKVGLVDRQRRGKDTSNWMEQVKQHDIGFRLTGYESNDLVFPWPWRASHVEQYNEIRDFIQQELNVPRTRPASIYNDMGFLFYDDEGEDAALTLGWMLIGLTEMIFEREQAILKKCPFCERYFVHETLKRKDFCTNKCRYDFRNKRS
jgi:hypothetical protein